MLILLTQWLMLNFIYFGSKSFYVIADNYPAVFNLSLIIPW